MKSADFGWKIRQARRGQHLTQAQLARKAGTCRRLIVDLESGKETVELGKALDVARALGLEGFTGQSAADIAKGLQVPRFWSAPDNVTPEILVAGLLKNPTFDDLLSVAREYGTQALRQEMKRLKRKGELGRIAAHESARMLRNIERAQHAA